MGSSAAAPELSGLGAAGIAAGMAAAAAAAAAPAAPQPLACTGCCGETLCERERGRTRAAGLSAAAAAPNTNAPAAPCWSGVTAAEGPAVLAAGPAAVLPSDAAEDWAPVYDSAGAAAGAAAPASADADAKARGLALDTPGLLLGDWRLNAARPAWALGAEAAAPKTKLKGACWAAGGGAAVCWPAGGCTVEPWCGAAGAAGPPLLSRLSRARRSAATESAGLSLAAAAAGAAPEVGVAELGGWGVAADAPSVEEG